jgi:ABC-2 type transport system permease protein
VKFRDVSYIWEVLLQAGFYATPILYPLSRIPKVSYQKVIMLNPMAQAIQSARYVTVTKQTITFNSLFHDSWFAIIPFLIIAVVLLIGVMYFKKEAKYFAENI